jgi:hypothetical protein
MRILLPSRAHLVGRRFPVDVYACSRYVVCRTRVGEDTMARAGVLKRKSFFVDERALGRARKALGVSTDAEVVRLSVERVAEMEEFWRFMSTTRKAVKRGSFRAP